MKRILVATDLGMAAAVAAERAVRLAAEDGADIRIVHVSAAADEAGTCEAIRRRLVAEVGDAAEALSPIPLRISVQISEDDPAESILGAATEYDPDLIVLGGHGEPRLRDTMFGTTATYVVRHSVWPVLIAQNDPNQPYSRVLVAVERPQSVPDVRRVVTNVAPAAEIFAVHAHYPTIGETLAAPAASDRAEAQLAQQIEASFAAGQGTAAHVSVQTGDPLGTIMQEAEKRGLDLLVMGTRRRSTFLNSNAVDAVFWCTHDLLVVPEREIDSA